MDLKTINIQCSFRSNEMNGGVQVEQFNNV